MSVRGRDVFWTVIYYCIVIAVYWYLAYDGPPLRVLAWYRLARTSQWAARTFGRVGLQAESHYYSELERSRG